MAPKVRAQRQSLAERVQKAGKAKAAQGASGASTARKRKAAEAELSDDPLDAEGQNALLLLLTSLAKDCLSQSGLTGDARSAAKAQLNELLAVLSERVGELRVPGGKLALPEDDGPNNDQHSIDAAHAELVKLDEQLEDETDELEQSKADLRTFERRRAAVEEREAEEERDKLDPLVRSLFPAPSQGQAEATSWITNALPSTRLDDVPEPETQRPDKWLADFAARALPTLAKLQRAHGPLEPLDRLFRERS